MTIPKSYEALAADLASEKILSKTLQGQKEAYMMIVDDRNTEIDDALAREAALREDLANEKSENQHLRNRIDNLILDKQILKQRLTVAEQRLSQVEGACDLAMSAIDDDDRGANFVQIILAIKDKAALKPGAGDNRD